MCRMEFMDLFIKGVDKDKDVAFGFLISFLSDKRITPLLRASTADEVAAEWFVLNGKRGLFQRLFLVSPLRQNVLSLPWKPAACTTARGAAAGEPMTGSTFDMFQHTDYKKYEDVNSPSRGDLPELLFSSASITSSVTQHNVTQPQLRSSDVELNSASCVKTEVNVR